MRNKMMLVALFVTLVALCAITVPSQADAAFSIKKITDYSVKYFPSPAKGGGFWATQDDDLLYMINNDGSKQLWGVTIMQSPTAYKNGVAFYTLAQLEPVVWNRNTGRDEYPIQSRTWPSMPWVTPSVSTDGNKVAFASGSNHIAVYDGINTVEWNQWDSSLWQLASLAWAPDGMIYATVQSRQELALGGYHLFKVNPDTKAATDLGMGYSQVVSSGEDFIFNSWDHQRLTLSRWTSNGFQFQQNPSFEGVGYWNLGGGLDGRFALLDGRNRLYEASVPEPSSILALITGLAGLGGFVLRRRK